jgi:iron(III) transport system substrate-binding protein
MKCANWGAILTAPLLLCAGGGCGSKEGPTVVVYTAVDDDFSRPIVERFEKDTGVKVRFVTDTEETKSTGLLNRLIAEKARPQADVFWSGDPVRAAILKKHGVAAAYVSPSAKGLPPEYSDPEHYWTGFSARARVLLVNTEHEGIKQGAMPQSVRDLADPRFHGKACVANPLFGTTSMHAAVLFESLGDAKAKEFFERLLTNQTKMLSSNGEVRRRVSNGEFAFGLTDTDDAAEAVRDGKPVKAVFPHDKEEQGFGTLVVPNAVLLIAGGPNPDNGKRFMDYLLRPETEAELAKGGAAQIPLRPDVLVPTGVTPLRELNPVPVNYARLADRLEDLSKGYLDDWVKRNQR